MSNVHGLFSNKKDDDDDADNDENNRFVGGIGAHGGGSGLAVRPNTMDAEHNDDEAGKRDSVFRLAENASSDDRGEVRRMITMYRNGFVVDDGPYRRLDDPVNGEFLRSLAAGRTPRELTEDSTDGSAIVVGLVDKRDEDYQEQFRSFSGAGNSLGSLGAAAGGSGDVMTVSGQFDPTTLPDTPPVVDPIQPSTSIQVRLWNGQRRIITLNLMSTVQDLATHLRVEADGHTFRLVSGYPPRPLEDSNATIEAAGLKGAQVQMQKI